MNIQISQKIFSPHFFPMLFDYSHRWEIYNGSAGSGKSVFITQKLILRAFSEKIKILVCRKYGTTIRDSVYSGFKKIITDWNLAQYCTFVESSYRIKFANGSEIIFKGLDEETKLLSLDNISCVWIEEAFEVERDIAEQVNLRMRGKAKNQQIILSFNPISKAHWLYEFWESPPDNAFLDHSTYKDNPFLSDDYIAELEALKVRNPAKARIYCYGEFGSDVEGLVFNNWKVQDFAVEALQGDLRAGCDFGYNDPTFFVKAVYRPLEREIYVLEEWTDTKQQLDAIASALQGRISKHTPIYCDSAEPRNIDYLKRQGFYAKPCIKGPDSVNARITFLQNNTIIVRPECKELIKELENFSYVKDKKTGKYTEYTTHEYSHGIDALGYAFSDIYTKNKLRTIDKSILGL